MTIIAKPLDISNGTRSAQDNTHSGSAPYVATVQQPCSLGLTIAATSLGFVLVQLDVSILHVALARIGDAIGAGVTGLQWVVDSYTIAFASLLLSAGALGDRIGARGAYMSGFALFVLASLGCGLAPSAGALIAARVVQ